MVIAQAVQSNFFRSVGAAALGAPLPHADREGAGYGTCTDLRLLAARHGSTCQVQHSHLGARCAEAEWAEAVARTKKREAVVRAKHELAKIEAQQEEEAAKAARQREEEDRSLQVEARQKRLQAMLASKEARRRAEAEAVKQREEAEALSWAAAVAMRKTQEREILAMTAEEQAMREGCVRRDAYASKLETRQREQLEVEANAKEAEFREMQRMAGEDVVAQGTRMALREAHERDQMAAADSASQLAAEMVAAAAWAESVERSKVALREERQRSCREKDAMCVEDLAAVQLRERYWELARIKEAEAASAAAAAAAVVAAKQREKELAAIVELEAQRWRAKENDSMENEDRQSRWREEYDLQQQAESEWKLTISLRKNAEHGLREAEARERSSMHDEDMLAHAVRREVQNMQAKRCQLERLLREQAAAEAVAIERKRQQHLAEALEAEFARAQQDARRRADLARQAMAIEDACARERRAEQQCCAEREAMHQEDVLAHALRRDARVQQRSIKNFEREFYSRKSEHRRDAQDATRRSTEQEIQRRCRIAAFEQQKVALKRAQDEAAQSALQEALAQRQEAQAEVARQSADRAAPEQRRALAEARRRDELLANENKKFEELYRQNRGVSAAHRSKEACLRAAARVKAPLPSPDAVCSPTNVTSITAQQPQRVAEEPSKARDMNVITKVGLTSLPLDFKCNAAEIVAFAQRLSELSPTRGETTLELDETATFFTDS